MFSCEVGAVCISGWFGVLGLAVVVAYRLLMLPGWLGFALRRWWFADGWCGFAPYCVVSVT